MLMVGAKRVGRLLEGDLVYRLGEYSFDTVPKPASGVTALLVNDLHLELDEDGRLLYVWGLCPHTGWQERTLSPPQFKSSELSWVNDNIIPGITVRINSSGRWKTYVDHRQSWVCVGEPDFGHGNLAHRFGPGAIAVLGAGVLKALWLQPKEILE